MMVSQFGAASFILCLFVAVSQAYNLSFTFGSDIGPVAPTFPIGDSSSGLFTIPQAGGPAVKHVGLFNYANRVFYDPSSKLLLAIGVDNTGDTRVWNTTGWRDTDLAVASFAPEPDIVFPPISSQFVVDLGLVWFNFLPPINGSIYQIGSDFVNLYVHKWNTDGAGTLVTTLLSGGFNDAYIITNDFKYIFYEIGDATCTGGVCQPPKVGLASVSPDYTNITLIKSVNTNCTAQTYIFVLSISPDGGYLIVGCAFESMQIFDITNLDNIYSVAWPLVTGLGQQITPSLVCQFPGGLTGSGYADSGSLLSWSTTTNGTNTTLNALTFPNPYQIAEFPSPPDLYWCASTQAAHLVSIAATSIRLYSTSNTGAPFSTTPVMCPDLNWVGTVARTEAFYHAREPVCNCPNKDSLPCPPGLLLTAQEGDVSDIMVPFLGFFLEGRDFLEGLNMPSFTTDKSVTLPVAFLSGNPKFSSSSVRPCANSTLNVVANDSRVAGKIVVVDYTYDVPAECGVGIPEFAFTLLGAGMSGFFLSLPPASPNQILVAPPIGIPIMAIQATMAEAIGEAWVRQSPPPVSPSVTSTPSSVDRVTVSLGTVSAFATVVILHA
jgi:hypothetical protein